MARGDVLLTDTSATAAGTGQPGPVSGTASSAGWILRRGPARVERFERFAPLWFGVLSLAYWGITVAMARRKLMWNDELYTYYIATLPTWQDVWSALLARGEQMPPLSYLPARLVIDAFGGGHVAARLPEMIGFWVMCGCLFLVVARRASGAAAVCAAALPLVTTAYFYAFEARPYALVLGASALALLCWQTAVLGRRRALAVIGLGLSLTVAICTHYYGILVLVPFVLGEAVRTLERRRIDVAIWTAMGLSVLPLALHWPLIAAGADYAGAFWSPPQWLSVPAFFEELLAPAIVPVTAVLVLAAIAAAAGIERARPEAWRAFPLTRHEFTAACGFILIPLMAVVLAKVVTGAFVNRYALPAVIGLAVLAGAGVAAAFRHRPVMRLAAAACLTGWFLLSQAREWLEPTGYSVPFSQASIDRPAEWLSAQPESTLPVVIADPHTFTVLWHYATPDLQRRVVYAADPDRAERHLGHNSVERGMLDLVGPWFGMNVVKFDAFVSEHDRFLVYGDFVRLSFLNWLLPELHARGIHTQLLNRAGDNMLLLASRPEAGRTAPVESAVSAESPRSTR